jgi:hypothetical protein
MVLYFNNIFQEAEEKGEEQELAKGVSWGMMEDAEEFPDMEQVKYSSCFSVQNMMCDKNRLSYSTGTIAGLLFKIWCVSYFQIIILCSKGCLLLADFSFCTS